jgi:hypothetical protein
MTRRRCSTQPRLLLARRVLLNDQADALLRVEMLEQFAERLRERAQVQSLQG